MSAIRRILVAIKDVDSKAFPAVLKAAQLARACRAEMELFHSLTLPVYVDIDYHDKQDVVRRTRQHVLNRLEAIATRVQQHSIGVAIAAEHDYPAHEAVLRRAEKIGADLIVAERHAGRHRMAWLLRLTDWELVRHSPVPVLLVKSQRPYRRPAVLAAIDPSHALAKPHGLDKELLRLAATLSRALHGTLHAVHAYTRVPLNITAEEYIDPTTIEKVERATARAVKARFARVLQHSRVASARRYLMAGHPIDVITAVADRSHSAIVVMGAISRSGLTGLFIGNTAEHILDSLQCDILVLKPRGFRSRVPRTVRGPKVVIVTAPAGAA